MNYHTAHPDALHLCFSHRHFVLQEKSLKKVIENNVIYGDIRTSAERDNSIQLHSQLSVQVTQRSSEDCSNTGAKKRQPGIHHQLAIVQVASEGHKEVMAVQRTAQLVLGLE